MIAILTLATVFLTLCYGLRLNPRSLLTQQRRRQNGSSPHKYSTAFTTVITSSEWLLKEGSARRGHSANLTFLPCHPEPSGTTGKKAEQAIEGVLESIAPGSVSWLYQQVLQRRTRLKTSEGIVEATLVGRLVLSLIHI